MEPSAAELSMPVDSASGPANMGHSSQTEIKVEHVTHSWTVKNFSHCYQEYLENFVHLTRGEETFTWSIKIYPKGNGENNKDFVFLCLNRVVINNKPMKIGFKSRFILKSSEGKDIDMRIHPNPSHSDYVSYIKRDVLFPQILPRDSIIVSVEIDVAVETITTSTEPITPSNTEKQLVEDYLRLFKEDVLTDFTIRVGSREIRTHRAVLAARSPVFFAMFKHEETNEAKNRLVNIDDVDHDVVLEMLHWIYAGRCSKDISEIAGELLIAADKYRLDDLKTLCETHLMDAVASDNACQLLVVADMYGANRLKQHAVQFILQRPKHITQTPGWSDILKSHPALVTDIVNNFDKSTCTTTAGPEPMVT